ncbi:SpoIIE family protein phosphatase [candidate division KSB1 bacterium]|nr:SpoIIE family protein phosphatase [candidate division KSB1 bacterium]
MLKRKSKEEITIPAHIDYLSKLRDFVVKAVHRHGFDDKTVNTFKLSIDEAATNIIKHGYAGTSGSITLRILAKPDSMTVFLIDQGKYFDPLHVKAPDLARYVNIRKKGGLGIFIMRRLMDSIEYQKTPEGNQLRMTKMRPSHPKKRVGLQVPSMSLSIKARYSIIMSAILTAIVLIGYFYYYFRWESEIIEATLQQAKRITQSMSDVLSKAIDLETGELDEFRIGEIVVQKRTEHFDIIQEIAVSHSMGYTLYSTSSNLLWESYKPPPDAIQIDKNIYSYNFINQIPIYEIITPIRSDQKALLGNLHVLFKKQYAFAKIIEHRNEDLRSAVLILLFGYLGIIIVVFAVMSPFQKLAEWVKALGHGDNVDDDMDITESGEIGEIAKAFSDITSKFKKSQESLVRQEQLQKEMQVAQEIQQTLLPSEFPSPDGYEIDSFYEAAKEVGGDYFDFVEVDNETLGIVVADVSGKGVPGSLVMTMIRTTLRTEARGARVAADVLSKVNQIVVNDIKKGMFVTVFYVIIDTKRRRLNFASAGHNPMILYRGSTKKTYYLNPRGFPIGISLPDNELFKKSLESDTIQLIEDDILLIYTDGITEAMNSKREMFGEERLQKVIREYGHLPVEPFVAKIRDEVHSFTEGFPQSDDITLVVIKEETSAEKIELKRAKKAHKLIQLGKSIREACESAGITTYAYYNKYKRKFEQEGTDNYEIEDESISLEAKHLSIEERTKIYDIIKRHPDYGAKRISEELNTEMYGFTEINETRIYDELVRGRLNTRKLREAFIAREKKGKPIKPPGTPLLTLDGQVIIESPGNRTEVPGAQKNLEPPKTAADSTDLKDSNGKEQEFLFRVRRKKYNELTDAESLLLNPIESVLDKELESEQFVFEDDILNFVDENEPVEDSPKELHEEKAVEEDLPEPASSDDVAFEQLLDGDSLYESESYEENTDFADASTASDEHFEQSEQDKQNPDLVSHEELFDKLESDDIIAYHTENETSDDEEDSMILHGADDLLDEQSFWDFDHTSYEDDTNEQEHEFTPLVEDTIPEFRFTDELEGLTPPDNGADDTDSNDLTINAPEPTYSTMLDKIEKEMAILDEKAAEQNSTAETADSSQDDQNSLIPERMTQTDVLEEPEQTKQQMLIRGLQYYHQRHYNAAINELKKVIEKYPNMKEAHTILGNAYFRTRMFEKAAREYERVKKIDPNNLDAYENMGVIYANSGNYRKAIIEWECALRINPTRRDIKNNIERVNRLLSEK